MNEKTIIIDWIKNNFIHENNSIYKLDIDTYKKLHFNNNLLYFYDNKFKVFIKLLRKKLKLYDIQITYKIKYIYSKYQIIYYIEV